MWDGKQLRALLSECSKVNYTSCFQLGMILPTGVLTWDMFDCHDQGQSCSWGSSSGKRPWILSNSRPRPGEPPHPHIEELSGPKYQQCWGWETLSWGKLKALQFPVGRERQCALGINWKQTLWWDGLSPTIRWSHPEEKGQDFRGHENRCLHTTGTSLFTLPRGSVSEEPGFSWLSQRSGVGVGGTPGWSRGLCPHLLRHFFHPWPDPGRQVQDGRGLHRCL